MVTESYITYLTYGISEEKNMKQITSIQVSRHNKVAIAKAIWEFYNE